jgi:hypothetical protein
MIMVPVSIVFLGAFLPNASFEVSGSQVHRAGSLMGTGLNRETSVKAAESIVTSSTDERAQQVRRESLSPTQCQPHKSRKEQKVQHGASSAHKEKRFARTTTSIVVDSIHWRHLEVLPWCAFIITYDLHPQSPNCMGEQAGGAVAISVPVLKA